MTLSGRQIEALVMRVQADFLANKTLQLSLGKAARRFGLRIDVCAAILDALLDAGVLTRTPAGAYARLVPRQSVVRDHRRVA
jgi:hypothetical protein